MTRAKSYLKAEVLEVVEADESGKDAEVESPQSPSSSESDEDSDVSVQSPQKRANMPKRQVVSQTTPKKTSPSFGTLDSTTPLATTRLKRAGSTDHSTAKLPDTVRRSNLLAVMESSDDRDPDEFLLSNDFDRTNAKKLPQGPTTMVRRSSEREAVRYTATGEPSAYKRSRKSSGSVKSTVIMINHAVTCKLL